MRRAAILLLAVIAGCEAPVGLLCARPYHETLEAAVIARPADILFVVDNSVSMAEEQAALARSFGRFIDEVAGSGAYRIAVVTTDQSSDFDDRGEAVGFSRLTHSPQFPHQIIDFDRSACRFMTPRLEHGCFRGAARERVIDSMVSSRQAQIDAFGRTVRVGTCGDGSEQALAAMVSALDQLDGCNRGFRRDDANLVIIFVSDEDDHSPDPIETYVDFLKARYDLSRVRIASVVGAAEGEAAFCGQSIGQQCGSYCTSVDIPGSHAACTFDGASPCPAFESCQRVGPGVGRCVEASEQDALECASCSHFKTADCCSALPATRYVQFARAMEQAIRDADSSFEITGCHRSDTAKASCVTETICQGEFGDTLARIARELVFSIDYTLSPPAEDPALVEVHLVGPRYEAGERKLVLGQDFTVGTDGSSIRLGASGTPAFGDDLRIGYISAGEPTGTDCLPLK